MNKNVKFRVIGLTIVLFFIFAIYIINFNKTNYIRGNMSKNNNISFLSNTVDYCMNNEISNLDQIMDKKNYEYLCNNYEKQIIRSATNIIIDDYTTIEEFAYDDSVSIKLNSKSFIENIDEIKEIYIPPAPSECENYRNESWEGTGIEGSPWDCPVIEGTYETITCEQPGLSYENWEISNYMDSELYTHFFGDGYYFYSGINPNNYVKLNGFQRENSLFRIIEFTDSYITLISEYQYNETSNDNFGDEIKKYCVDILGLDGECNNSFFKMKDYLVLDDFSVDNYGKGFGSELMDSYYFNSSPNNNNVDKLTEKKLYGLPTTYNLYVAGAPDFLFENHDNNYDYWKFLKITSNSWIIFGGSTLVPYEYNGKKIYFNGIGNAVVGTYTFAHTNVNNYKYRVVFDLDSCHTTITTGNGSIDKPYIFQYSEKNLCEYS